MRQPVQHQKQKQKQRGGGGASAGRRRLNLNHPNEEHNNNGYDDDNDKQQHVVEDRKGVHREGSVESRKDSKVSMSDEESSSSSCSGTGSNETDGTETYEVLYGVDGESATPLYRALEDMQWREALKFVHEDPDQAKTWVNSTGTVATTFNWTVFRRLPLHEACRRQAPAWLVSALVSAWPGSVRQTTHFRELPLHLAVECGAPPEVVNLLVVAHWHAVMATDQSGRTPLQVLEETGDTSELEEEDRTVVYESLLQSVQTYKEIQAAHAAELQQVQLQHAAGLAAIRRQHDADLQLEQEQQEQFLVEVDRLTACQLESKKMAQQQEDKIEAFTKVEAT